MSGPSDNLLTGAFGKRVVGLAEASGLSATQLTASLATIIVVCLVEGGLTIPQAEGFFEHMLVGFRAAKEERENKK